MNSDCLKKLYQSNQYSIVKIFKSKQNKVRLIEFTDDERKIGMVEKNFSSKSQLEKEVLMVELLKKSNLESPECYLQFENILLYQYLPGETLCEILEHSEDNNDEETLVPFYQVIEWLEAFHRETGFIMYDINLRNFLNVNEKIVAIDFEDARKMDLEVDYGRLLAFILTYDPSFTHWKISLVKKMEEYMKNMGIDISKVIQEKEKELFNIEKRRKVKYV